MDRLDKALLSVLSAGLLLVVVLVATLDIVALGGAEAAWEAPGSPVAVVGTPVPVDKVDPDAGLTDAEEVAGVQVIPGTGSGAMAGAVSARAHAGPDHWIYYCSGGIKWQVRVTMAWAYPDYHSSYMHHHALFLGSRIAVGACY